MFLNFKWKKKKALRERELSVYFVCIFISKNIAVFFTGILLGLGS